MIKLESQLQVTIADINEDNGKKVLSELSKKFSEDSLLYVKCDVTDDESFRNVFSETVAKFGGRGLDILCNNAGVLDEKNWTKAMQVNYVSSIGSVETFWCRKNWKIGLTSSNKVE